MWFLVACTTATPTPGATETGVDSSGESGPDSTAALDTGRWPNVLSAAYRERVDPVVCAAPSAPEGVAATLTWTVDGAPFTGLTLVTQAAGDTVFPGYTRADQLWTCTRSWPGGESEGSTRIHAFDPTSLDPYVAPSMWIADGALHYTGALARQPAVSVLYGFDGWSSREAPPAATTAVYPEGTFRYGVHRAMFPEPGGWALPLDVPDTVRVVSAIFDAEGTIEDHAGTEYTWDLVFPSIGPFLTWDDSTPPSAGIVVNWATGQPGMGRVEYGPDREHTAFVRDDTSDTLHHVSLTNLPPATRFDYRVLDSRGRASPWASFITAAATDDTFTFLVASDMQDAGSDGQRWPELATTMVSACPDARFILAPGDLSAQDAPGFWWLFFDGGRELFDHIPIVPSVGNHDTPSVFSSPDTRHYRRWFALPSVDGNEDHYRLDYGRMRVFAISTESLDDLETDSAQFAWISAELERLRDGTDADVDWVITQAHHPGYDIGKRFAVETPRYRPLTELFDGVVDVDIRAHEHIYQRYVPLRFSNSRVATYGRGDDQGVAYVVTPSAGFEHLDTAVIDPGMAGGDQLANLAWPELAPDQGSVAAQHGFLVGSVTPTTLSLSFVEVGSTEAPEDATVVDELRIER